MKVLVIDDNTETTSMLSKFFESKGIEVKVANEPFYGLKLVEEEKFDVVILDMSMPGFSGGEIVKMLATKEILCEQKIVIFSAAGLNRFEIKDLLRRDGIHAIVKKPMKLEKLLEVIKGPKTFEYC